MADSPLKVVRRVVCKCWNFSL